MSRQKVQLTSLETGLRVVTHRVPDMSRIDITVGIMAGARDEVDGDHPRGTMHFLEHVLACGSHRYTHRVRPLIEGEDEDGEFNLATQLSFTNCHAIVPAERAEFTLEVLGGMVSAPHLRDCDIDRERGPIQAERIRNKLNFASLENIVATHLAHGRHPRLHPVIGSRLGIDAVSADILGAFHTQHVRAGRVIVGIEGDISHDHAVKLVRRSFSLPAGERAPTALPAYTGGDARFPLNLEGTHSVIAFKAPVATDFQRAAAFQVASKLLNAANNRSRHSVFDALRGQGEAVYSVGVAGRQTLDSGLLTIAADMSPRNVGPALRLIRGVLQDMADQIDQGPFHRLRAQEEKTMQRLAAARKIGSANLVDDVFLHDGPIAPDHYSGLRSQVDMKDVSDIVRDMLDHPPTFLAAGDTDGLPDLDEIREMFGTRTGPVPEPLEEPDLESAM